MRRNLSALIIFAFPLLTFASTVDVGEEPLEIKLPVGFATVTADIQPLYDTFVAVVSPNRVPLLFLVDESIIPKALAGEKPGFDRHISVETIRQLMDQQVSQDYFDRVKTQIKESNESYNHSLNNEVNELLEGVSDKIGGAMGDEVEFSMPNLVLLPAHLETEDVLSYSGIMRYTSTVNTRTEEGITVATKTAIYIRGKILFLDVWGGVDDLDWTRQLSAKIVREIIHKNSD